MRLAQAECTDCPRLITDAPTHDVGYPLSAVRFFAANNPTSVLSAEAHVIPPAADLVDKGMSTTLAFPNDVVASVRCHFGLPPAYGFIPRKPGLSLKAECEGGELTLTNFVLPTLWHSITVSKREGQGRVTRTEKAYTFEDGRGEPWWTTYASRGVDCLHKLSC